MKDLKEAKKADRRPAGWKVVLGVSGSIAAYKAADLSRRLVQEGVSVTAVLSRSAPNFIGAATFSGITGKDPVTDLSGAGFAHLSVADGLDAVVVAPATANIIAKLAAGVADCALTTIVLAADCPIIICPAMNEKMWFSRAVQRNIATVEALGYELVGPSCGSLACGDSGWGRLADLDDIEAAVFNRLHSGAQFKERQFVVTAGPTREYLDPVRFLSNPSSGKTGYAIAEELARRGGETVLISGPTGIRPSGRLKFVPVESALEMRDAVKNYFHGADALVMTAAVADHRFAEDRAGHKIPKSELPASLDLTRNPDILREISALKRSDQVVVGFAAQTHDGPETAGRKLVDKNLDMVVCTKVGFNEGFGTDDIEAMIVNSGGCRDLGRVDKRVLARKLADILGDTLGN